MTSSSADEPNLSDRLANLLFYAPLGLLWERDQVLERLVRRGRSQTQIAKLAAQLAAQRGPEQVEAQVRQVLESLAKSAAGPVARVLIEAGVALGVPGATKTATADRLQDVQQVNVGGITGYDDLSAREVLALLGPLAPDALAEVRRHEASGRNRKTVLAKLDQLLKST